MDVTEEIRRGVETLFPEGSLVELRIPKSSMGTIIGFFRDREKLIQAIEEYSGKVPAVYYTLNSPPVELYDNAKMKDKAIIGGHGCKDDEVVTRNWLLCDCDPVRVDDKGIELLQQTVSSTDSEKAASLSAAYDIKSYLQDRGWPEAIVADSGNGAHLLYNLGGMPSTPELTVTIQEALQRLAEKFNTKFVHVDTVVSNPSRITKSYGSLAAKGPNTADRPHRYSRIISAPLTITPVTVLQLSALKPTPIATKKSSIIIKAHAAERIATTDGPEKMEEFLEWYDIAHKVMIRDGNRWKFVIVPCPFNPDHNHGEVAVFVHDDGGYGFKCFHESCKDNHWQEFVAHLQLISGKRFFFKSNVVQAAAPNDKATSKVHWKCAANIAPEVLSWLWKDRIPFGKLTLFAGHPGVGKGMATMYVSACASKGCGWKDCPNANPPVKVAIVSSEDAAKDTLIPRLMAADANLNNILILNNVTTSKGDKDLTLDTDIPALRETLEQNPEVKVIIIDPIMNHLGRLKGNSEQEVRLGLSPLAKLAEQFGVAIILVTHYNKSQGTDSIQRVGGAMGMVGAVRVAWSFGKNKLNGKMEMTPLKANIAPNTGGLEYEVVSTEVEINGQWVPMGKLEFGEKTHSSADATLSSSKKDENIPQYKQAAEWLIEHLSNGEPKPAADIYKSAESMGYSEDTMKSAVKDLNGLILKTNPVNPGPWFWQIPKKGATIV
jgi:hypothetical protein